MIADSRGLSAVKPGALTKYDKLSDAGAPLRLPCSRGGEKNVVVERTELAERFTLAAPPTTARLPEWQFAPNIQVMDLVAIVSPEASRQSITSTRISSPSRTEASTRASSSRRPRRLHGATRRLSSPWEMGVRP